MAPLEELGKSALVGWRKPVADKLSKPLADKTPLSGGQANALLGVVFFVLSVVYVVGTVKRVLAES
jgi:hypothetical protein